MIVSAHKQHPTGKSAKDRLRIENRFWEKVDYGDADECWEWNAYINPVGYAYFWIATQNRKIPAHRVAKMLDEGIKDPSDLSGTVVRHKCDNPACCNPEHLVTGSQSDNMQDAIRRDRVEREFSPSDIREIRELSEEGVSQYDIAKQYGVTQAMISEIVRGEQYAWVE
jgi:hypothetical protein